MEETKQVETLTDEELVKQFYQAKDTQIKLTFFSGVRDASIQMGLLDSIPDNEKYKFIGKIKSRQGIALALNKLENDTIKNKTFHFIAKQMKGNREGILKLLAQIDFNVEIPFNMLVFQLNNLNAFNLDFLMNIQKHVTNYMDMKFKINEEDDSRNIEYSFSEISAIVAKMEELTADIPQDMDEANQFYRIYSRLTNRMIYDYSCIRKSDDIKKRFFHRRKYGWKQYHSNTNKARRKAAGLYGGLVEGKAICAGYALILHEALLYRGIKSQYVYGYPEGEGSGHAWNQVQINGKWYNADPTWDSQSIQMKGCFFYMLLDDEEFEKTHSKYSEGRKKTQHVCKDKFDVNKIAAYAALKQNSAIKQRMGRDI